MIFSRKGKGFLQSQVHRRWGPLIASDQHLAVLRVYRLHSEEGGGGWANSGRGQFGASLFLGEIELDVTS